MALLITFRDSSIYVANPNDASDKGRKLSVDFPIATTPIWRPYSLMTLYIFCKIT